jgi:hypothetical protein
MQLGIRRASHEYKPSRVGLPVQQVPQHVKKLAERAKMAGLALANSTNGGRWEVYRQTFCPPSAQPAGNHIHCGLGKKSLSVLQAGRLCVSGDLVENKRDIGPCAVLGKVFRPGSIPATSIAPGSFSSSRPLESHDAVYASSEPVSDGPVADAGGVAAFARCDAAVIHASSKSASQLQTQVLLYDGGKRMQPKDLQESSDDPLNCSTVTCCKYGAGVVWVRAYVYIPYATCTCCRITCAANVCMLQMGFTLRMLHIS